MIHLDTGFLIRALTRNSTEDRKLRGWLKAAEPLAISTISWAEFLCGPVGAGEAELAGRILLEPVAFTGAAAALTARLFNLAGRRRGSLTDCMIAAIATRAGAALATTNPADFRRFEPGGLELTA